MAFLFIFSWFIARANEVCMLFEFIYIRVQRKTLRLSFLGYWLGPKEYKLIIYICEKVLKEGAT